MTMDYFYEHDFPNPAAMNNELDIWIRYWQRVEKEDLKTLLKLL